LSLLFISELGNVGWKILSQLKGEKTMRCEWEVIFQISPGVSEPETIGDYHFFLDEEKRTCVKWKFSTESYRQQLPQKSHGSSEYAEETLCNQYIEDIKRLLLIWMIYQEYFEPINVVILKKPFLLNREELKKSGEKITRPFETSCSIEIVSIKTGNSLAESLDFYDPQTKDDAVLRIANWLEQCESAQGEVEKFRILWAAFNSLFTVIAEFEGKSEKNEKERIKLSIGKLISPKEAEEITAPFKTDGLVDKLISFNIVSDRGDNFSSDLNDAAKPNKPDWLLLLKKAVLCIYGIRNAIFHDGPRVDNIEQKAAVAKEFLSPVVKRCLHKIATTNMIGVTQFERQPR
jgi:hypothetical protein